MMEATAMRDRAVDRRELGRLPMSARRRAGVPSETTKLRTEWLTWLIEQNYDLDIYGEPPVSFRAWLKLRRVPGNL